jgi:OOP family OmpA-OmpF porin
MDVRRWMVIIGLGAAACGGQTRGGARGGELAAGSATVAVAPDPDGDGMRGDADGCADVAEDVDGFEDADGCPDTDNDRDSVPDAADRCPDQPAQRSRAAQEVPDAAVGCPLPGALAFRDGPAGDLDDDGYADTVDACPEAPENFPSKLDGGCTDDGDGCPDGELVLLIDCAIDILAVVNFDAGKATLGPAAVQLLADVARVLVDTVPSMRLAVIGHTDDKEAPALAAARADAVVVHLAAAGVVATRLEARAAGAAQPRVPVAGLGKRAAADARAQNRRVSFEVIDAPRLPGRLRATP